MLLIRAAVEEVVVDLLVALVVAQHKQNVKLTAKLITLIQLALAADHRLRLRQRSALRDHLVW